MMSWHRWNILTWWWMRLSECSQLLLDWRGSVRRMWKSMGCPFPKGQQRQCQSLCFTETHSSGQSLRSSVLKGTRLQGRGPPLIQLLRVYSDNPYYGWWICDCTIIFILQLFIVKCIFLFQEWYYLIKNFTNHKLKKKKNLVVCIPKTLSFLVV